MNTNALQTVIEHFGLKVSHIEAVEQSFSSTVKFLEMENGERLVLKIPFVQRKIHRELTALAQLKETLPVPRVLDYWLGDNETPGALLLSLLPGKVITWSPTTNLAFELGALLGKLHTHKLACFGDVFEPAPDWWQMLAGFFQQWQMPCQSVMPSDLFQKACERYKVLYAGLPRPDGPCWTHFDYRPGNVLALGERISGLIDFESARGGSADLDFIKIKEYVWDVNPDVREPFLRGYASIRPLPDIENTLPFYTLHNALGGIAWCVKRANVGGPFFHENMCKLEQLK